MQNRDFLIEYAKILDEMENLQSVFSKIQEKTEKLREMYYKGYDKEEVEAMVKKNEKEYATLLLKFKKLNERAKILKEKIDSE